MKLDREIQDVLNDYSVAIEFLRESIRHATPCNCGFCWCCRVQGWLHTEVKASPSRLSEAVKQIEALLKAWPVQRESSSYIAGFQQAIEEVLAILNSPASGEGPPQVEAANHTSREVGG